MHFSFLKSLVERLSGHTNGSDRASVTQGGLARQDWKAHYGHLLGFLAILACCLCLLTGTKGFLHASDNSCKIPPFISTNVPPMVMLVMSKDHTAFFEAYTDTSDLDEDGTIDTTYKDSIDYYGYFDHSKCYTYSSTNKYFSPNRNATGTNSHTCGGTDEWSGNFLNWVTMSRMDVLRRVLYGGYRDTEASNQTILRRVYIPNDGHSWVKVYTGDDVRNYTPYNKPSTGTTANDGLSFYNVTCKYNSSTSKGMSLCHNVGLDNLPIIRVANIVDYDWDASEVLQGFYDSEYSGETGYNVDSPSSTNRVADLAVRVEACVPGLIGQEMCRDYVDDSGVHHYRPIGLLHKYGENDAIHFGLLTGTYKKNISGGVVRKNVSSFGSGLSKEIDPKTGVFVAPSSGDGIIKTIDKIYLRDFKTDLKGYTDCGPTAAMSEGNDGCRNWGNPISEMMYEAMRYFAGTTATSAFNYDEDSDLNPSSSSDSDPPNNETLDPVHPTRSAPVKVAWDNPYTTHPYCSKPYVMVLSDIYPSYDDDQVPGNVFNSAFSDTLSGFDVISGNAKSLDAKSLANQIATNETGFPTRTFIGETNDGTTTSGDQLCSDKGPFSLGQIRGLCPGNPGIKGSYYSAAVAYFGKTTSMKASASDLGDRNPTTFVVALSNPLPTIRLNISGKEVSISPVSRALYQSRNTNCSYVKSRIIPHDSTTEPGVGELEIVWEDSYHASDFDKDWIQRIKWTVNGDQLVVETWIHKFSAGAAGWLGYVVNGTSSDAQYMDLYQENVNPFTFNTIQACPTGSDCVDVTNGKVCKVSSGSTGNNQACYTTGTRTVYSRRTFSTGTSTAQYLKPPLWYAAKYGGFTDLEKYPNNRPDLKEEWTSSTASDPDPDNYFFVANPAKLFQAVDKAFGQILQREGSAGAVATVTQEVQQGDIVVRAAFEAYDAANPSIFIWQGHLEAYRPFDGCSAFSGSSYQTVCESISGCTWNSGTSTCKGEMYGFQDPKPGLGRFCIDNPNGHCWDGGDKLRSQTHANRTIFTWLSNTKQTFSDLNLTALSASMSNRIDFDGDGNATSEDDQEIAVDWTRGEDIAGTATRLRDGWILGDIVYSTPVVVGAPTRASVPRKVANQDCTSAVADERCFYNFLSNKEHRKQMVYVGANDAMLHAFNMGVWDSTGNSWVFDPADNATGANTIGKENWAYIPSNLLSELQDLAVATYGTAAGCKHRYTVDLSPQAWDVKIDHDDNATSSKQWRTVLLGGEREGGDVHFALDITNPDNATVLWEHSLLKDFPRSTAATSYTAYYDYLKTAPLSKSLPYMGRLNTAGTNDPYVAFFGGGIHEFRPDQVDANATLSLNQITEWKYLYYPTFHAVAETGTDLWKTTWSALLDDSGYLDYFSVNDNATYVLPYAVSNVAAFDIFNESGVSISQGATQDGFTDLLFAGDYNGTLFNILETYADNSTSPTCMITRKTKAITNANTNPFRGSRQPITVTPVAALDEGGNLRVYFGTGKFSDVTETNNDKTDNATMTFYCMVQDISSPISCGDNTTTSITTITTPPFEVHEKCRASAGSYRWVKREEISGQNVTHADGDSCFPCMYDFETPGERVIDSALVAGGYVFFTTFIPSTDPCVPSGTAYLYVLDYMCRPLSNVPITNGSGVVVRYRDAKTGSWTTTQPSEVGAVKISLGDGMPSRPVLDSKGENLLVQTSDARLLRLGVDLGASYKATIKGWTREIQ